MSGKGVPPPVSLHNIINDLFQNEKYRSRGFKYKITFSQAFLTKQQKSQLIYPHGFTPLNLFIIYQIDKYNEFELVSTEILLISFIRKHDTYIFGVYFDVINQYRFDTDELKKSSNPISLDSTARFLSAQYLELYNNVLGTTVILGLSTKDPLSASLQYSHNCKYFYEKLSTNGIVDPDLSTTLLTGLSKNLEKHRFSEF